MACRRTSCTMRGLLVFDLPSPLAVVCHDAGAANLILAWLDETALPGVRTVMEGPAARLWENRFGSHFTRLTLDEALHGAASVLSGTGWGGDVEHRARQRARELAIPSVAVIDHWVNYADRFLRSGTIVLPDVFWVTDEYALLEARRCFPGYPIRLRENRYLLQQLAQIAPVTETDAGEVLYALEPARAEWGRGTPGEFQALDFLADHLREAGLAADAHIRLRPHPSDPPGKYQRWMQEHPRLHTSLDDSPDIARSVSRARWVAGCESFALVIALGAGRNVICTLPPWAPACRLPHSGMIHLKHRVHG